MTSFRRDGGANGFVPSRRALLAGLGASVLAGCTSDPNSDTSAFTQLLVQNLNPFSPGASVTIDQVSSIPYASIGVRLGNSGQLLLVMATSNGERRLWTSAARIAIETRSGRIVTTAGFEHNLTNTNPAGPDPVAEGLQRLHEQTQFSRNLDFADRNLFQTPVLSNFVPGGPEDIVILGSTIKTIHVQENCTCEVLDWQFTNDYWADINSGMIWKSVQTVHPDLAALELEIFRPPADAT